LFRLLNAPLDLANCFEVVVEHDAIFGADAALEARRFLRDDIENADVLLLESGSLLRRVALTEESLKELPRVGFHGQRRCRSPERNCAGIAAAIVPVASIG